MLEILPIKLLSDEDSPIFGKLNVALGKLLRVGLPVGAGIVVTAPEFRLKTALEHFDFGNKEVIEQSLTLVRKELNAIPIPDNFTKETKNQKHLLLSGEVIKSTKLCWQKLLHIWIEEIKRRLWKDGFYPGITQNLQAQVINFVDKVESHGNAYFDSMQDDVVINVKKGKLHPMDQKKLVDIVQTANKKLFIPQEYEWILDKGLKLTKVLPYTPVFTTPLASVSTQPASSGTRQQSAVKIYLDLSKGLTIEKNVDGIFIASEKIFDLSKPNESFDNLVFKVVESSMSFPSSPCLVKLADISEGMGKVRGTLRLLHQKSLLNPLIEVLDFARHKKGLLNVHIVAPYVRSVSEFVHLKRDLAVRKLSRKRSLQLWLELAVPENIINLEEYLLVGLDGVVLNLDELISHLNGFDPKEENLSFYKHQVEGLIKFLEDAIRLLHKSKIPFIALGSLSLNQKLLEFLVDKGVFGIVVERYEAPSAVDLLKQTEKRIILRKVS